MLAPDGWASAVRVRTNLSEVFGECCTAGNAARTERVVPHVEVPAQEEGRPQLDEV